MNSRLCGKSLKNMYMVLKQKKRLLREEVNSWKTDEHEHSFGQIVAKNNNTHICKGHDETHHLCAK